MSLINNTFNDSLNDSLDDSFDNSSGNSFDASKQKLIDASLTANPDLIASLQIAVPDIPVVTATEILRTYRRDFVNSGQTDDSDVNLPLALLRVEKTSQVQAIVRWCAEHKVTIIPRGAGTGVSGAVFAEANSVIISFEKMNQIEIDPIAKVAIVEPGAINSDIKKAAAEYGLWYPPDPSSFEMCSIGGNVNTNAGGICCVKYGVTVDYVLGLEVVLANGNCISLGGPRLKDSAGYSLSKLFVGSEGTLGLITRVTLKLVQKTTATGTLVAELPTVEAAVKAVVEISTSSTPSALEFMDQTSIALVESDLHMGLNTEAGALLIMQTDHVGSAARDDLDTWAEILQKYQAGEIFDTTDPAEAELFLQARRHFFVACEKQGATLYEDVGVPLNYLVELITQINQLAQDTGLTIATVAHAGDGNTHPTIIYNPHDAEETQKAREAYREIIQIALNLQGTISGEHGVGRLKAPWLEQYLGSDVYELQKSIKNLFDPQGILNPGAKFIS